VLCDVIGAATEFMVRMQPAPGADFLYFDIIHSDAGKKVEAGWLQTEAWLFVSEAHRTLAATA
jgi:hypothetical protein